MRRDPEAEILDVLEDYFRNASALPATPEGKVNVSALTAALGLRAGDAQYFHRSLPIKEAVNAIALEQGLLPIGHRAEQDRADALVADRLAKVTSKARADAQGSVEARHAYAALFEEHNQTQLRIAELERRLAVSERRLAEYEAILPYECLVLGASKS